MSAYSNAFQCFTSKMLTSSVILILMILLQTIFLVPIKKYSTNTTHSFILFFSSCMKLYQVLERCELIRWWQKNQESQNVYETIICTMKITDTVVHVCDWWFVWCCLISYHIVSYYIVLIILIHVPNTVKC